MNVDLTTDRSSAGTNASRDIQENPVASSGLTGYEGAPGDHRPLPRTTPLTMIYPETFGMYGRISRRTQQR